MKRNILYAVLLVLSFTACRESDVENVFYTSPEARMRDTLTLIKNELTSAPYGWKGGFATGLKGGYGFYFQFKDDQTVKMLSDYSTTSGSAIKESTYRVSAANLPTLIFDTYNYISIMSDPVPGVAGGNAGQGFRSDIEYSYVRKSKANDSLFFVGKKYELPFVLVKATPGEQQSFLNSGINTYRTEFTTAFNNNYVFSYINGGQNGTLGVEIDYTGKLAKFSAVDATGNVTAISEVPFFYTSNELSFVYPFYIFFNGKIIKSLSSQGNKVFAIYLDNSKIELSTQNMPLYSFDLVFDYNKPFKKLVAGTPIPGVAASVHVFDQVGDLFVASGRTISNMYFGFNNSTTATFYVAYSASGTNFTASATYQYRREGKKLFLKRTAIDANFNTRAAQLAPVNTLFGTGDEREFVLDWVASSNASVKFPIGAIKSASNPSNMLYGRLGE